MLSLDSAAIKNRQSVPRSASEYSNLSAGGPSLVDHGEGPVPYQLLGPEFVVPYPLHSARFRPTARRTDRPWFFRRLFWRLIRRFSQRFSRRFFRRRARHRELTQPLPKERPFFSARLEFLFVLTTGSDLPQKICHFLWQNHGEKNTMQKIKASRMCA